MPAANPAPPPTASRADGRRARGQSSRTKIVAALLDLVSKGDVAPSAARVAEIAGVGLRSVFRHFEDMDALYREMGEVIEARILPIMLQAPVGETWQDNLMEIVDRRARIFEETMPYRISASLRRFESPYLMQDHRRFLRLEIEMLAAQLPAWVKADAEGARALTVALSFQTWRSLRHDQELSADLARAVVRRMVGDIVAGLSNP